MKMSIRFAVLGILLAVAAPAPVTESLAGLDQEAVLESCRSSRTGGRIAPSKERRSRRRAAVPSPAPGKRPADATLAVPGGEAVVPRILSRPPPV